MAQIDTIILILLVTILSFTPFCKGTEEGMAVWGVHALTFTILLLIVIKSFQEKKFHFKSTPLDYPILAFLVLSLLASFFSINKIASFNTTWKIFDYCVIYYAIVNRLTTKKQAFFLIYTLITTGTLLALWGVIKYLGSPGGKLGYELTSTFTNSNHLAAYFEMVIPIFLVIMSFSIEIGKKIILGYCLFMISAAFILTLSRGGWLSLSCAMVFMGILYVKRHRVSHLAKRLIPLSIFGGIALIVILGFGFQHLTYKLDSFFNQKRRQEIESVNGRVPIWKATIGMIYDYPILGTGPGTFPYVYESYLKRRIGDKYVHSEYLQVMSEWGIMAFLVVLWMQVIVFQKSIQLYFNTQSRSICKLVLGIIGSLVAISVHSLMDFNLHFMANTFIVVVLTGIIMSVAPNHRNFFSQGL